MRSGPVVIGLIFPKGPLELRLVEEQKMVGAFALQSSVESLHKRVSDRRAARTSQVFDLIE